MRERHRDGVPPGFTLIELIVALLLLTVGLGALAGTSVWLLRETTDSRRTERAATLARSRLEMLRVGTCEPRNGSATHRDLVETWSISVVGTHATAIVSVSSLGLRPRVQHYQSAFQC